VILEAGYLLVTDIRIWLTGCFYIIYQDMYELLRWCIDL